MSTLCAVVWSLDTFEVILSSFLRWFEMLTIERALSVSLWSLRTSMVIILHSYHRSDMLAIESAH
jgi:hypothetical protein